MHGGILAESGGQWVVVVEGGAVGFMGGAGNTKMSHVT